MTISTRHLVDPELLALADNFPPLTLSDESLPAIRGMFTSMLADQVLPDLPVETREVAVPSREPGRTIRCLMIRPSSMAPSAPAILHFHGGGHVMGAPEMNQAELMQWAAELDCLVLSVDYRLAPETPFPGPMEDAQDALHWLHGEAQTLGIDKKRIAMAGQSAGGAMAACLALMTRDEGEIQLAFQLLEAPRLDDRIREGAEANPFTGEFVWTRQSSAYCRKAYLGGGNSSPYASALRATDVAGLPPTFVAVGALDLFVDECVDYCGRLLRAGVPTELIVYPGCFHGFQMAAEAQVTLRSHRDTLNALKKALVG